ncbi:GtrA-like protein [Variovorax boronicumulans]|uniref:GtrA family protein n=1 Tax=Variovorax boronicumulans TaxID=436515 RepID=UPI000BB3A7A3|nr:GtrA family protein [Variovorax boronicumulans]PBI87011.1 GtrA-like protein [Variovorax boronicumulans]
MIRLKTLTAQFSKFTVVGGLNFLFTLVLFYLSVVVLHINHLIALVLVSLIGMLLTYTLNYYWVFKPSEKVTFGSRLAKYIGAGLVSVGLNVLLLHLLTSSTHIAPFYGQLLLIPFVVLFNFFTARLWSLRAEQPSVP